ncbi:MAG: sugar MFS transporter [Terracidiphilus sp.]|jgi:FHS family L-fucose permease-like MFS transporter
MATRSTPPAAASSPNYIVPFITVTILFGIFGFLTNLNSNLMPHLKSLFDLSYGPAMLVSTAWFFAYLLFSVPSAKLIELVGYKRTMVISLFIMVVGALLFIPAATQISFPLFLTAIFVLAIGVCALQTSANPYVSILGPEHSAPARLTLSQAFNSLGAAVAPLVVAHFILTDPSKISNKASIAHTVQGPYMAIAAALLVLGFAVMFMHLPAVTSTRAFRPAKDGDPLLGRSIWSYTHTVLGMFGIFFYVGVEIALAAIAISYFLSQGVNIATLGVFGTMVSNMLGPLTNTAIAGVLASLYFLFIMAGRFLGSALMAWFKADKLLAYLGFLGVVFLLISMFSHGSLAIWTLVLCGLANSIMYPTIFALGVAELGPMTSKGSGVITMGNVGGAVIPLLFGSLADKIGIQYAFIVPIVAYLYIAYYGLSGHKPTRSEAV